MKRVILMCAMVFSTILFAQTTAELKKEIEDIKTSVANLHTEIQSVKSENIYLKQVLDINKPVLEKEDNNTSIKITKVVGNRKDKTISITFLVEAKDANKVVGLTEASYIDIEGNAQSPVTIGFPDLALNVPLKQTVKFSFIQNEPKIIKLFRFKMYSDNHKPSTTNLEFKDLNVTWE
ncbi:MAG: transposase [Bergeyella sp.]